MRQQVGSALTLVGAVVGAGFASGREVYHFFSRYGLKGLVGVFVAIAVLLLLCARALYLARRYRAQSLSDLIQSHLGRSLSPVLNVVLLLALWLGLGVMLSGAGAAGESLQINKPITIITTGLIISVCLYYGISGIKKANTVLIPILVAVALYLFWRGIQHGSYSFLLQDTGFLSWGAAVWSAILYAGLNSLLLFVVIPPLALGQRPVGLVLACLLFGLLLLASTVLLLQFPVLSAGSPVPMLSIAADIAPRMPQLYGLILWTALTTTALANGLGVQSYLERNTRLSRAAVSALVVASSLPIAVLPFAQLVAHVYTALGYIALGLAIAILKPCR